jgi:hypothetical protein
MSNYPELQEVKDFLSKELNKCTATPLKVITVECLTEVLTNDPGHEILIIAHLGLVDDENHYYSEFPILIDIPALEDIAQGYPMALGDHALFIEQLIGLNTTVLLPFTFLK